MLLITVGTRIALVQPRGCGGRGLSPPVRILTDPGTQRLLYTMFVTLWSVQVISSSSADICVSVAVCPGVSTVAGKGPAAANRERRVVTSS